MGTGYSHIDFIGKDICNIHVCVTNNFFVLGRSIIAHDYFIMLL